LGQVFQPGCLHHVGDTGKILCPGPGVTQMVERGERVRLATAELRDERKHRRGVRGLAIQAAQHHAAVVNERIGKVIPSEKLFRLYVIGRRGARCYLLQVNGKLTGIERPTVAKFLTG